MQVNTDYTLLLSPLFSAMTKITDNLFLTGVSGMTRSNLRKNHIDFIVNITTEAPFWEGLESMRLPLEDDPTVNILPYMDMAVDRINEAITMRHAHVLVHCVAGVSRSATIVIAYLMKFQRMDLHTAFNYCYNLRPVIRPNNGFMAQLINYEQQLFGRTSVRMIDADVDGIVINVPHFFIDEHPRLVLLEVYRVRDQQTQQQQQQSPPHHHRHHHQQQQPARLNQPATTKTQTTQSTLASAPFSPSTSQVAHSQATSSLVGSTLSQQPSSPQGLTAPKHQQQHQQLQPQPQPQPQQQQQQQPKQKQPKSEQGAKRGVERKNSQRKSSSGKKI